MNMIRSLMRSVALAALLSCWACNDAAAPPAVDAAGADLSQADGPAPVDSSGEAAAKPDAAADASSDIAPDAGLTLKVVKTCKLPAQPKLGAINFAANVAYATMDGQVQRLDISWPKGTGPFPLVVMVHGGGWTSGSKTAFLLETRRLAGAGYAAATVSYRLAKAPKNIFPAAVQDVRCAVRWLRDNSASYSIDPKRVAAVGTSAGGHLVAMLGTASDKAGLDSKDCDAAAQPVSVSGVASFYGVHDMRGGTSSLLTNFLGAAPKKVPLKAALASPLVHVDASDPPMLLVHGTADKIVPVTQSRAMKAALDKAGVPALSLELNGAGHAFGVLSGLPAHRQHGCTLMGFLKTVFGQ